MKLFVAVAVIFLVGCEATFFGKTGHVQLSGNFHGLAGHPWLGVKQPEEPVVVTEEAPIRPIIVTDTPFVVPETPNENQGHGFSIHGQLHGLFKKHKLLSRFHGNKEVAPAPAPIPEVIEPQPEVVPVAPITPSKGFDIQGQLQGLLQNHRWLSGSNGGFSLQGNLQGLLKNHRLLAGHFNKNQPATTTEDPFGGDNTGFSVSSPDVAPEVVEVPEPVPVSNDVQTSGFTGSFTASAKGGHDIHKIIGTVVDAKRKLLEEAKNQVSARFDNHINNLDKLKGHFEKSQPSEPVETTIDGQFSLKKRKY